MSYVSDYSSQSCVSLPLNFAHREQSAAEELRRTRQQLQLKSEEVDELSSQLQAKDQELTAAQSALQVNSLLRFNAPPDGLPLTRHFAEGAIGS